jgi:hypothetical protein
MFLPVRLRPVGLSLTGTLPPSFWEIGSLANVLRACESSRDFSRLLCSKSFGLALRREGSNRSNRRGLLEKELAGGVRGLIGEARLLSSWEGLRAFSKVRKGDKLRG